MYQHEAFGDIANNHAASINYTINLEKNTDDTFCMIIANYNFKNISLYILIYTKYTIHYLYINIIYKLYLLIHITYKF